MTGNEQLVERITRRVMAELATEGGAAPRGGGCADCRGGCAGHCSDKVRQVVSAGADRVTYRGRGEDVPADLAAHIDHTLLKPEATPAQIDRLCAEAVQHGFAAVCVNPVWVRRAAERVRGTPVRVASVVGFPLGATPREVKAFETRRALRDGAREIDMVIAVGALKGGEWDLVERDVRAVSDACHEVGALAKVILETALLTDEEKVIGCRLAKAAKADYVKTSTGFSSAGATVFDVALMREAVGGEMGVKAAGGIKSAEDALSMLAAGATRIGASAGVAMVAGNGGGGGGGY